MRTQDLNRYETLARKLSCGEALDPVEVEDVLRATDMTHAELSKRAQFHRDRRAARVDPGLLEAYQQETKVMGVHEGVAIIVVPLLLLAAVFVIVIASLF